MIDTSVLSSFTGTTQWYRFSRLFPNVVLTDGTKYVADQCGAYWIMDAISSYQPELKHNSKLQQFQLWILKVNADKSAILTCQEDSDIAPCVSQYIDHTDFEMPELRLYCMPAGDGKTRVILLPSEY